MLIAKWKRLGGVLSQWPGDSPYLATRYLGNPSIHQFINTERSDLKECRLIAGRSGWRRRSGKQHQKLKLPAATKQSIEELPNVARERSAIGHLELNTIIVRRGGAALENKTCRRSRKIFLDLSPSLEALTYSKVLIERLSSDIPTKHRYAIFSVLSHSKRYPKVRDCLMGSTRERDLSLY